MTSSTRSTRPMLRVEHTACLAHAQPAAETCGDLRLTPVDTGLQTVVTSKIEMLPRVPLQTYRDYFGNAVAGFELCSSHPSLTVRADSVVETTDAIACGPEAGADPRPWRERLVEFVQPTPRVPVLDLYGELPGRVTPDLAGGDFLVAVHELAAALRDRIDHDPATPDTGDLRSVFEEGRGNTSDLAHAMIGALRSGGVPARFASGYRHDEGNDRTWKACGVHAWAQVWHEEFGWVGIDPSEPESVGWQYVRIGVGRDAGDVEAVRGTYRGSPGTVVESRIRVSRLR